MVELELEVEVASEEEGEGAEEPQTTMQEEMMRSFSHRET